MDGPPLNPVYLDKPCEICGDIGYADIIRICCKCKITREHVYCMRIYYEGEPEDWVCENCASVNQISSSKLAPIEQPKDTGTRFNIRKPPRNTKVQYITVEEAMVLESGAIKKTTSSPCKVNNILLPRKEAIRCSALPPKFSVKPNPQFGPPGFTKPLSYRVRPINALHENLSGVKDKETDITEKRACKEAAVATGFPARKSQTSNATSEKEIRPVRQPLQESPSSRSSSPENSLRQNAEENNTSSGHLSSRVVKTSPVVSSDGKTHVSLLLKIATPFAEKDTVKSSCASVQTVLSSPAGGSDVHANAQLENCDPKGKEPLEFKLELDRYLLNHPANYPTWKGRFNITSDVLPYGSFDGIRAYPPCKVHRKVYDMSKELPNALQLQPLPRLSFWMDLFEDDVPGALDIGLYFLSSQRPEESYTTLLEFLDVHDLVLRCHIDGVELLVFSSKHLLQDLQRINQSLYLWGLFRSFEGDLVASKATDMTPSALAELDDMEIDMAGGYEISDKIDRVVPKRKETKPEDEASIKKEVGAVLELTSHKRETPDDTKVIRSWTMSSLQNELEFERELQSRFDHFVKLMKPEAESFRKSR